VSVGDARDMDDIHRRFNPDQNGAGANACASLALLQGQRHGAGGASDPPVCRQLRTSLSAVFFRPRNPEEKDPQTFPIV
jgi:hypothetical protein